MSLNLPHSVEEEHWTQVRSRSVSTRVYEALALAVCEDAYLLASQYSVRSIREQRELRAWIHLFASECSSSDPRRVFCLDVICAHFGWDESGVRASFLNAISGPPVGSVRRTTLGPSAKF